MRTRTEDRDSCLVLKSSVGVHKVHMSEIIYIEALNRKIIYYLRNNSQITCVEKFASVCDQLLQHPEFLLAHRSFLVNMNYIRRIDAVPYRQNPTVIDISKKARPPPGTSLPLTMNCLII